MASPPKRFAVVSPEDKTALLATITVEVGVGRHLNLSVSGENEGKLKEILAIAQSAVNASRTGSDSEGELLSWAEQVITDALEKSGRNLQTLPDADYQISFEFDVNHGPLVGEQTALHSFVGPNDELAARVRASIASAFQKGANDLTAALKTAFAQGNMGEAVSAIRTAKEAGIFALPANRELLDVVSQIDTSGLPQADRFLVRGVRLTLAQRSNAHDIAGQEAEALLAEHDSELDERQCAHLQMMIAWAAVKNGQSETALTIWRDLLSRPGILDAGNRGWAWRNIAMVLGPRDAEAQRAARRSADAFLEAGNKEEGAASLKFLSDCLRHEQPARAVSQLDEIVALMDKNGLLGRELRAEALHLRCQFLGQLGKHREALKDALEEVELRRGLIGGEVELVSSLHLTVIEAKALDEAEKYAPLKAEADKLGQEIKNPRFRFGERLTALFDAFNADDAEALARDATAEGDLEVVAGVRVLQATKTDGLPLAKRLQILEATLQELEHAKARGGIEEPTFMAIATLLINAKEFRRAVPWVRKILERNPFHRWARDALLHSLWEGKDWCEAAAFLKQHIALVGEMPGLLTAYGRSLLEAGDVSASVPVLTKAIELASDDQNARRAAFDLRERALKLGGTVPQPVLPAVDPKVPVTTNELAEALSGYAQYIAANMRMGFWSKGARDYEWVANPERHAQNLLHTFLKGRLQDRISVFEELSVGAGRLDLYLRLAGGLSAVIELKMCGFGYSSAYAAGGEEQILHYLENMQTYLGYLVIHDARLDKFEEALLDPGNHGPHRVTEIFVDVRPRVSSRRSAVSKPKADRI